MEYVEIKKVGKVVTGNTPSKKENKYYDQNYIEFVKPSNFISGKITNIKKGEEYLSYEGMKKGRVANKGDVLVTCIGNIGNVGIVEKKVCFNQQINAIRCNENYINNKYLANVIRYISPLLTHMANKAVVPILNKTQLENIKIPIFSMETQEEIANILEIIQKNIDKRKEQILLADELIKSRFIEMFGDPIRNKKGWEIKKLGEVTNKISSGATPTGGKENYKISGISLIRSMNVHNGYFEYKDLAYISNEQARQLKNVEVELEDILLNITGASIARSCLVPSNIIPARVNQHVMIIRIKNKILNSIFLNNLFLNNVYKQKLINLGEANGATRQALTKIQIEKLEIILPPLSLQNEFAEFATKIDKLKFEVEKSLKEMENLYDSLMQKFFKQ